MFRKSTISDCTLINQLYKQAIEYLKNQNIDQWQHNYPNMQTCMDDINHGYGYVYCRNNHVIGTVSLIFGNEADYDLIYNGQWLNDKPYATIHRLVVDQRFKGNQIAFKMLQEIEKICLSYNVFNIRVDTHHDNVSMQRFLVKNGFIVCGDVYLKDLSKRLAYQKILK
jgi:ribosomal protein S18 acetylase RimI-like enzyme